MESLWIPPDQDLFRTLAQRICADHAARLPDLTSIYVLLPDTHAAPRLRRALLRAAAHHGHHAVLGARITTLRQFAAEFGDAPQPEIDRHARELLLAEALARHPHLYGRSNPWALAENLLQLFDELTLNSGALPGDAGEFAALLARGYGMGGHVPSALSREATLVHTLWRAWHEQLAELRVRDASSAYLLRLASATDRLPEDIHLYCTCTSDLTPPEWAWLAARAQRGQCTWVVRGSVPHEAPAALRDMVSRAGTARAELLAAIFDTDNPPLAQRARAFAAAHPLSPLHGNTVLFTAQSDEEEANAVDLQVRLWLLDGLTRIGIVTESRRLARRVRAILERAGIELNDFGGWALSTTRAATVLERWLQTVEEDFAHEPLLDVLKSPLVFPDSERDTLLRCVWRFEEDIVRNGNIARGLDRYLHRLRIHRSRLPGEMGTHYPPVQALLERVRDAAEPLRRLLDTRPRAPEQYLDALRSSIERLGLLQTWPGDAAGAQVMRELEQLHTAARQSGLRMPWAEFRAWLGRALERAHFIPDARSGAAQLLSLAQCDTAQFDAVIVAGCEPQYFPGGAPASPFFNNAVRAELGLPTAEQRARARLRLFTQLLATTPRVTLTRVGHRAGEDVIAAPWWDLLATFHAVAWNDSLTDAMFAARVRDARARIRPQDTRAAPPAAAPARTRIDPRLIPASISANAYQCLVDCPYQFFAAHCLKLRPPESIREALRKDDYGQRVHLCLEAFYRRVAGLPEPFGQRITPATRDRAIAHLEQITDAVFARDLEDNFRHRDWHRRWRDTIPAFIDWEIGHQSAWRNDSVEVRIERALENAPFSINGRIDRIDMGNDGLRVIDYKTGTIAKEELIRAGESIQLPFYALLLRARDEPVLSAELVDLDNNGKVRTAVRLERDELAELREKAESRLRELIEQLRNGVPAPASGDATACKYCTMAGLCRKPHWNSLERGE